MDISLEFEKLRVELDGGEQHIVWRRGEGRPQPSHLDVTGPHLVQGCKPGKTFAHVFTPEQEAALIGGGHIKIEGDQPHG